jgi:hypothetical protein
LIDTNAALKAKRDQIIFGDNSSQMNEKLSMQSDDEDFEEIDKDVDERYLVDTNCPKKVIHKE